MPKALSGDLRERVIEAVEAGASRREAAERFEISASSAVKWLQRWRDHGVRAPKPRGGSRSVLEDYGPNAGRDCCSDAKATDSGQPQRALAIS
jgi:transposase